MESGIKRISIMIREDQHEKLLEKELNVSGLIRDLIDDYFSDHSITLTVERETKELYDKIVSNTGSSDSEIEPHLRKSLKILLKNKIDQMQKLHKSL